MDKRRRPFPTLKAQRGIALIMVLGLVIFLSLIAVSFSDNQRVGSQVAANALAAATAQAAADGAVNRMVYELEKPRSVDAQAATLQWKPDGLIHQYGENGVQITISARNETAKIDLNFAAEPLLKQLFVAAGANDDEANALVAAVKDWTDADNLKRPNGAEADDYKTAGRTVLPSNDFFIAIEELQNVLGVTPKIYNAVAPYITVNGRSPGVDPHSASAAVLRLVPGLDGAQIDAWVEQRDQALREGLTTPPLPFGSPYFAGGVTSVRIRADAVSSSGVRASREASVRLGSTRQRGRPQYYLWQRGLPADMQGSPKPVPAPNPSNG